jgi:hypothetical protein
LDRCFHPSPNISSSIILIYTLFYYYYKLQCNNGDVRFVLDQYAELDFYSASSQKQQSARR